MPVGDGVPAQQHVLVLGPAGPSTNTEHIAEHDGLLLAWPTTIKENTGVLTITLGAKFDCDYNDMITFLRWTSPSKATAQCSTFGRIRHCGLFKTGSSVKLSEAQYETADTHEFDLQCRGQPWRSLHWQLHFL